MITLHFDPRIMNRIMHTMMSWGLCNQMATPIWSKGFHWISAGHNCITRSMKLIIGEYASYFYCSRVPITYGEKKIRRSDRTHGFLLIISFEIISNSALPFNHTCMQSPTCIHVDIIHKMLISIYQNGTSFNNLYAWSCGECSIRCSISHFTHVW